ncbi:SCO family protein [uncultured Piscinibacter sp.]|uniref:SCO family protein n=1 Tax=uncultured Piscinibacter sp. TaxID=1131835 RepID=UPI002623B914|nr:SCO family protein [uncultured Piscinibacter sp.]
MAGRPLLHLTLLALGAALSLCSGAAASPWPTGTPPGQPPAVSVAAVDQLAPAPTLAREDAIRSSQAAIGRSVAGHALLDRDGRPVPLSRYRGKPLLVSFIYTGCFQVCPTSTRSLQASLQSLYQSFGAQHFNVISIGFNQPADSPQAMRAFAAQHRIDEPNWDFLSAPPATVDALTRDFGFSYRATPSGFDHVVGVTVVDGEGRVHAQVYGERLTPDQLGEPLRRLLRGAPAPEQAVLADLIERVRIVCTVYDPETGRYRTDYGLILEIAGGATFLLTMLVFFIGEARKRRRGPLA